MVFFIFFPNQLFRLAVKTQGVVLPSAGEKITRDTSWFLSSLPGGE